MRQHNLRENLKRKFICCTGSQSELWLTALIKKNKLIQKSFFYAINSTQIVLEITQSDINEYVWLLKISLA